MFMHIYYIIS